MFKNNFHKMVTLLITILVCTICAVAEEKVMFAKLSWEQYQAASREAAAHGYGDGSMTVDARDGKLIYNADGTPASAVEYSWIAGTDEVNDRYYKMDENGNLVPLRQYDPAHGLALEGSGSSSKTSSFTSACEHEYTSEITKEPTCVEPGEKTYTCSKCGHTYTEEISPTGEHDFEITVEKEPTCTETGLTVKVCKVCGYREEVVMPALGHDYEETVTKEPTCTEPGVRTFTCKNCGDTYTEEIPALGHDESEWVIVKEPGWFAPGLRQTTCKRCGEILNSEEIPQMYPIWYLIVGIGAVVVIVGLMAFLLTKKHKKI